jgi:hypothetical protein
MTDPKRLLHASEHRLTSQILRAGVEEAPSPRALRRALQFAGVGVGALATDSLAAAAAQGLAQPTGGAGIVSAATPSLAASNVGAGTVTVGTANGAVVSGAAVSSTGVAVSGAGAAAKGVLAVGGLLKWAGVSVMGVAVATGTPPLLRWVEHTESRQRAPAPTVNSGRAAPADPAASKAPERAPVESTLPHAPAEGAPAVATSAPRASVGANDVQHTPRRGGERATPHVRDTAPGATSTLSAEMASVERARAALRAGQSERALAELDHYERAFPRPQLSLEVLVLRMEAFAQAGDTPRARALALEIISGRASAPHAARAREILQQAATP